MSIVKVSESPENYWWSGVKKCISSPNKMKVLLFKKINKPLNIYVSVYQISFLYKRICHYLYYIFCLVLVIFFLELNIEFD